MNEMGIGDPGYQTITRALDPAELPPVIAALEGCALRRSHAGARHLLGLPAVRALADDDRLVRIARSALGGSAIPFRATLGDKSMKTNWLVAWHQDTALPMRTRFQSRGWGPWTTKDGVLYAHAPAAVLERVVALRIHLDASTGTNGPLRVLPRTHTLGRLSATEISGIQRGVAAVDCLSPAGGIILMRPLLLHASSKSRDDRPRRVLHVEYAARMEVADGVELAVT